MGASHRWQDQQQRRIGITGGIASGKSSIGSYLLSRGLPVLDADLYAHEALMPGSHLTEAVVQRFGSRVEQQVKSGEEAIGTTRKIDRQALGQIIFQNSKERLWLEQLIHPEILERFEQDIARHAEAPALALVIPLLFEKGLEELCTEVWVVSCFRKQQQERLMARNGLSAIEAEQRIQAQWPLERKSQLADQVIDNSGTPNGWQEQVSKLL